MSNKFDKQAIFTLLNKGAKKVQTGIIKGAQKAQEVSETLNAKIEANPKAQEARDKAKAFAETQKERICDVRIGDTRIGDLPNAAQRMTERQLFKLLMKVRDVDPDFNWNQYVPNPEEMPIFTAFETLGLPYGTSFEEVKKTYRSLLREWHPDRHASSPEAERIATTKTQELTAAYELIEQHYGKNVQS